MDVDDKPKTSGIFSYSESSSSLFKKFKQSVKIHLQDSKRHEQKLKEKILQDQIETKLRTQDQEIGMRNGRTCYKIYYNGRSYSDFEDDLLLQWMNGCIIGDINHSRKFVSAFRPYVYNEIKRRLEEYLTNPLPQTGHQPALNVAIDKATHRHKTRQFISAVTIVPGSEDLITVVSLGCPGVKGNFGKDLAKSAKDGLDAYKVSGHQIEGASVDGQYFNLDVPTHFAELYDLPEDSIYWGYDGMHRAGLVDTHLCKLPQFSWFNQLTKVCVRIYKLFNWGQNHELLLSYCKDLDIEYKTLVRLSDTRMANSRRFIYINLRNDLKAIQACLEDKQLDHLQDPYDAKKKERANEAKEIGAKIFNLIFLLSLAMCADVYNMYGVIINLVQTVNMLPYERFAKFKAEVKKLQVMKTCLKDHELCKEHLSEDRLEEDGCYWKFLHEDIASFKKDQTIKGIKVFENSEVKSAGTVTRYFKRLDTKNNEGSPEEKVYKKAEGLLDYIHKHLDEDVYDEDDVNLIAKTEVITDATSLVLKLNNQEISTLKIALTEGPKFISAIRSLPVESLQEVSDTVLMNQFENYLNSLRRVSWGCDPEDLDSKVLIQKLLHPKNKYYCGSEMILQAICVSALKLSVESVLESQISIYEHHFRDNRPLNDDSIAEEFQIAINGPCLAHYDSVVYHAMSQYWDKKKTVSWHFTKKDFSIDEPSVVLQRLKKKGSKLPFMEA